MKSNYIFPAIELMSPITGQAESRLRNLFTEATKVEPSIIILEDIEAISPQKGGAKETQKRLIYQLKNSIHSIINVKRDFPKPY